MDNTCHKCEVAWKGDSPCWVCGRQGDDRGPPITVAANAQGWRFEEGDEPDLAVAARRRTGRFAPPSWIYPVAS